MKGGGSAWPNLEEFLSFINRYGTSFHNDQYYIDDGKYYLKDENYDNIPYEKRKNFKLLNVGKLVADNKSLTGGRRRKSTRKSTRKSPRRGNKSRRTTRRKR